MEGSKYFTREYNHHHNSPADLFYLQREAPSLSRTHRSSSLQMNQMLKDVFRGIEGGWFNNNENLHQHFPHNPLSLIYPNQYDKWDWLWCLGWFNDNDDTYDKLVLFRRRLCQSVRVEARRGGITSYWSWPDKDNRDYKDNGQWWMTTTTMMDDDDKN